MRNLRVWCDEASTLTEALSLVFLPPGSRLLSSGTTTREVDPLKSSGRPPYLLPFRCLD
jgi:hypothetical protein